VKTPKCSLTSEPGQRQASFWTIVEQQVRRLVGELAEWVLDLLVEDHLRAGWNQRVETRGGHRNGYYQRSLITPHGPLSIRVPRLRCGGFDCSVVFDRYQRRIADVEHVLSHCYLLGHSTRAAAELAEQIYGASLSHQTISRLMRRLDDELAEWRKRPLEPVYRVVYIDGMHVSRVGGDRRVMLATGRRFDGALEVLDFCVSRGERCLELLANLRERGLEGVELFVSDDCGAVESALEQVYPEVARQDCTFHRLKRLREKIGGNIYRDQMVAEAGCVFRCDSELAAWSCARLWRDRWRSISPAAVEQFMEGLGRSLSFYSLPKTWWKRTRTNNPMENQIRQLRRRLDAMDGFHDDPAIERAVFGQLLRWHLTKLTQNT
jgi:putative transposase